MPLDNSRPAADRFQAWLDGDSHALDYMRTPLGESVVCNCFSDEPVSAEAERASDPERASEAEADEVSLLETKANTVSSGECGDGPRLVVTCAGCRSWFCERCCVSKGLLLRGKIIPILATFRGLLMITLTVDPQAFDGDEEAAYRYVRKNRCIARLMRELRRRKLVFSERWFSVVEWQGNGFAHYHVLIDADFVDQKVVHQIWNNFGPGPGRTLANGYHVRLGIVSCNSYQFASTTHAAHYATKYLVKVPERGFPKWVRYFQGRIRRHACSRDFESAVDAVEQRKEPEPKSAAPEKPRPQRTIAEIVARCGQDAALFVLGEIVIAGGEVVPHYQYLGRLESGWQKLHSGLGGDELPDATRHAVPTGEALKVLREFQVDPLRFVEDDDGRTELLATYLGIAEELTTSIGDAAPRLLDRTLSQTQLGDSPTAAEKTGREGAALPAFVESHPSPPESAAPPKSCSGGQSSERSSSDDGPRPPPAPWAISGGQSKGEG